MGRLKGHVAPETLDQPSVSQHYCHFTFQSCYRDGPGSAQKSEETKEGI